MSLPADRRLWPLAVAFLLITVAVGPAVAADHPDANRDRPAVPASQPVVHQQQATPVNNSTDSTVRHERSDSAAGEGNLTALRRWLAVRIDDALVACAEGVDAGTNETCEAIESEFPSLASRYAAVAEATEETGDDNVSRVLNRTAERQLAYVRAVREYRETLAAYREARRGNDVQRARELAQELSRQGERVVTLGSRLSADYETILANGTLDVAPAGEITEEVTANVSETTEEIRTAEFDPPTLTVSANSSTASFVDPVAISGELRADDGTPLANRTVVVSAANATFETQTDPDGTFEVVYRPTTAPTGPVEVVARYVPGNGSQYTATVARTNVSVESVEGTLRLGADAGASALGFGDDVSVVGSLRVDGRPVAGVPVTVVLDGIPFNATRTNESGGFALSEPLPAAVANGSPTLAVRVVRENRAVTAAPASTTVPVDTTTPALAVRAARLGAETVRLSGRMTVGDTPVTGARLEIRRGTETLATVRSGEAGSFATNVSVPDVPANESVAVTVAYDPPGGNLAPADVTLDVGTAPRSDGLVPDVDTGFSLGPLDDLDPTLLALGALVVLVVLLAVSGLAYESWVEGGLRSVGGWTATLGGDDAQRDGSATSRSERARIDEPPESVRSDAGDLLLDAAEMQLREEGSDAAVVRAYAAARRSLDARFGIDPTLTHWELLTAYRDALDRESGEALERLTAAYERAAFSSAESTTETADEALKQAGVVVGTDVSASARGDGGDD
ncbi:hypothetical protein [Candidatus Halobonum tyrrellensis]|uniref:DUF4129 domain-containing protein n=1 Tax=Candidatus Halobonum tyrrellensis G22 TaxID=1324957 RepID=V4GXX8_9EURY|nr:hypothetical protein [Candidatus Halobonum tyrrellensis]ESP90021.1 hypothetical protein K933_00622 [Candidatus Halobonum tyrrellensis G22]